MWTTLDVALGFAFMGAWALAVVVAGAALVSAYCLIFAGKQSR